MATIRKRNDRWQVQIRRQGCPPLVRSFLSKADAVAWARQTEADVDRHGLAVSLKTLQTTSLAYLLVRYRDTVTPMKRGKIRETFALNRLLKHDIAKTPLATLTLGMVATYRDERLKTVKPASLNREFAIYRHVLETARRAWDVPLTANPFADVTKPKVIGGRSRRLQPGEWGRLEQECRRSRNPYIRDMVEFRLETAMRRGEVLNARWRDVDLRRRILQIPHAKNGHPRAIPLTASALSILTKRQGKEVAPSDRIFPTTEDAVKMAWRRIMARACLPDFRYHDLRHEAVSRFFELGLTVPEVALISGHRDPRMLARYTHLRPENVAEKLARLTAEQS